MILLLTSFKEGGLGKLKYPLLSDLNKCIASDYNVLLEKEGIALRGLFIIDPKGIIRHMSINDLPIGRSVDETLRLIEALKFVEEHGEGKAVQEDILYSFQINFVCFSMSCKLEAR